MVSALLDCHCCCCCCCCCRTAFTVHCCRCHCCCCCHLWHANESAHHLHMLVWCRKVPKGTRAACHDAESPPTIPSTCRRVPKEYKSGMINSWNKFCYTGGYVEAAVQLPGNAQTSGFWVRASGCLPRVWCSLYRSWLPPTCSTEWFAVTMAEHVCGFGKCWCCKVPFRAGAPSKSKVSLHMPHATHPGAAGLLAHGQLGSSRVHAKHRWDVAVQL